MNYEKIVFIDIKQEEINEVTKLVATSQCKQRLLIDLKKRKVKVTMQHKGCKIKYTLSREDFGKLVVVV